MDALKTNAGCGMALTYKINAKRAEYHRLGDTFPCHVSGGRDYLIAMRKVLSYEIDALIKQRNEWYKSNK